MDLNDTDDSKSVSKNQPSPSDFEAFLTWASTVLQMPDPVVITKVTQDDYVSVAGTASAKSKKSKGKPSKMELPPDQDDDSDARMMYPEAEPGIQLQVIYDAAENVVKLNFEKNRYLPRKLFTIIGLIIKFHYYLHTITINKGLDKYCIYEISKFLPLSRITDLCLDNSFVEEANYHILLEQRNFLRHLSLARCSINDAVVENIAAALTYPLPSSRTLCILNLSSNKITDIGANFLAEALRSNRQLCYLNLSGNMLTDSGAGSLLNTMLEFPLTFAELLASRSRHMTYLKEKNKLIIKMVKELRAGDLEKRAAKRKSASSARSTSTPKKKGLEKEPSLKSVPESKSINNVDMIFMDKATTMAENLLGDFADPFDKDNTRVVDSIAYSYGNNSMAYLSLAYNDLSFTTLTKLLKVLRYQKTMGRKPKGLINVSIEGNPMPVKCKELTQIDELLEMGLMMHSRRYSLTKKRAPTRGGSGR